MTRADRVDVLFIAGIGRSGTTLLSRLLGAIDGIENVGEFAAHWSIPAIFDNELPCGCGVRITDCPRWGKWTDVAPITTGGHVIHNRTVFNRSSSTADMRRRLGDELARRYLRARQESRARLLVDASKRPALALALAATDEVKLHLAHMVRDPRAVAASRNTAKQYLRSIPAWKMGPRWTGVTVAVERVGALAPPRAVVRYEDLVAHPRKTIEKLLEDLSLARFQLDAMDSDPIEVGRQHSLAGNPDKLEATSVSLRVASAPSLGRWERRFVELTTLPRRRRYGY